MTAPATGPPGDTGSALVEFVALAVLLMVPLVYLVTVLGRLQAAAFATDSAARSAARAFAAADDVPSGRARALAAVRLGLRDQGFDDDAARAARISCSASPCLSPQGRVAVQVTVRVGLPGVPAFVDRAAGTEVVVRSEQVAVVDAFRGTAPDRSGPPATRTPP